MTMFSPMKLLRSFPNLHAQATIKLCCQFVKQLPEELYDQLSRHVSSSSLECTCTRLVTEYLHLGMGFIFTT